MTATGNTKAQVYTRYPISTVLAYNGTTILHYGLGGGGIIHGYNFLVVGNTTQLSGGINNGNSRPG